MFKEKLKTDIKLQRRIVSKISNHFVSLMSNSDNLTVP